MNIFRKLAGISADAQRRIQQAYMVKQAALTKLAYSNAVVVTLPRNKTISHLLRNSFLNNEKLKAQFMRDNNITDIHKVPAGAKLVVRDILYVRPSVRAVRYDPAQHSSLLRHLNAPTTNMVTAAAAKGRPTRTKPVAQVRLPNYDISKHQYQDFAVQDGTPLIQQLRAVYGDFVDTPLFRQQYIYVNHSDPFMHKVDPGSRVRVRKFGPRAYPKAQYIAPKNRIAFHAPMLKALQFAQTGTFADPWIRTSSDADGKGSSAWGPLQMNQALVAPAMRNYADRLAPFQQYTTEHYLPMTRLMLEYGKQPDKKGYMKQFDYQQMVYPQSDWAKDQYFKFGGAMLDIAAQQVLKHKRNRGRKFTDQQLADEIAYMWRLGNDAYGNQAQRHKVLKQGYIDRIRKSLQQQNAWRAK